MQVVARMDLRRVRDLTPMLVGISVVLLLAVKVPGVGVEVNGATRWLGAGPLQFQPSELAKIALVLYCGAADHREAEAGARRCKGIFRPLGVVVGACGLLIVSQPDLGTFLVIAFTMTAILVAAGMPLKLLGKCLLVGVLLIGLFALLEPYRRDRLTAFIDPWAHADTIGYQSAQGQIALGSGGFLGPSGWASRSRRSSSCPRPTRTSSSR